jgi:serine/threonine-protein kinase
VADLGEYKIKKLVQNQGGYVSIFRATSAAGDPVLLRVLNAPPDADEASYRRFTREFETLEELRHPAILPVLDCGVIDDKAFYAVPFRPTLRPLEEWRASGNLEFEWTDALDIGLQVLEAVDYMHGQGVLHRDLRTTTVYYDMETAQAVIAEFSMVRNFNTHSLTLQGVKPVSIGIISPEAVRDVAFTEQTDLYLLGNLIYEVIAGVSGIHLDFGYKPLHDLAFDVPDGLDPVLARALAEEPGDRYPDLTTFAAALREVRGSSV